MGFILTIDAGTSNSRAAVINQKGEIEGIEETPFPSVFPEQGWIEHKPLDLWETQKECIGRLMRKVGITADDIKAIGIANQRETSIVWNKETGEPIWNAIVWNDSRTKEYCNGLKKKHEAKVRKKTGLFIDSYFSASKIRWILDNVDGAQKEAEKGNLLFGTVNTWLLYKLTDGKVHATDVSNASRTLLYNIHDLDWDDELLKIFNIPRSMMPEVKSCSEVYGETRDPLIGKGVPIASMIGDQQAALYGHNCFKAGDLQATYGTGTFLMMNTGSKASESKHKLLTTIAWQKGDEKPTYALEGAVLSSGSVVKWLRDNLGIIRTLSEIEGLAYSVPDTNGLYFVTALHGLGTPYWDFSVCGTMLGISASTNAGHIARAVMESTAYQVFDVVDAMRKDAFTAIRNIKCGGGMSEDVFLMQIQADLLGIPIARSANKEMTAMGAAYMAGLAVGFWKSEEELSSFWKSDRKFEPIMKKKDAKEMTKNWHHAIKSAQLWAKGYANS